MKTKAMKGLAMLLAAALTFSAPCAWAGEGWGGHHKNGDDKAGHFEKMAKGLGLSDQQKDALTKRRETFMPKMKDLREKTNAAREVLRNELDKAAPDKAKLAAIIADLKNLAGEKVELMIDRTLAMKEILTPEQYAKMRTIMEKKREEFKAKRGEHAGRGHEGPAPEDM